MRASALIAVALVLWALPNGAAACPVCFQANGEENRIAFLVTTVLLTLLPLVAVGGIGAYLWRSARRRERRESRPVPTA